MFTKLIHLFVKLEKILYKIVPFMNKSISRRITVLFIPLIVSVTISIFIISYYKFSDTLQSQVINDTGKIIDQVGKNTDFYFKDIMTPMAMLVQNTYVVKALKDYDTMDAKERLFLDRDINEITNNINIFKSYLGDLIIVGKNGFVANLASSPNIIAGYDFLSADWMQEAVKSHSDSIQYISPHKCDYYYPTVKPYDMAISAVLPVKQEQHVIGYIICDINLKGLNNIFDTLKLVEGGLIYMVDREGKIVFHPDAASIGTYVGHPIINKMMKSNSGNFIYKKQIKTDLVVYSTSPRTGWILVAEIPYDNIRKPALETFNAIIIILIAGIIFTVIMSYFISLQIKRPLNRLIKRIQSVENHDFKTYEKDPGYGEIGFLRLKFEGMVSEINTLINDVYVSRMRQREAEFEALQNQINPHFLYNALQLVKAEAVLVDNHEISSIVTSLGYLLRYAMNTKHEMAKVSEEIEYIKNYLEIYKKRFGDKFSYFIHIDESLMDYYIPKLILQPIVENSIKHGLSNTKNGGIIRVMVTKDKENMVFEVFDNGIGISEEDIEKITSGLEKNLSGMSIGLENVNNRLKLKYGERCGIRIHSEKNVFTKIVFNIPIEEISIK